VYAEAAAFYDAIQASRGLDAGMQAWVVLAELRRRRASVGSLLDAGCGTGLHLPHFAAEVPEVVGLDLSPHMLAIAADRLPGGRLVEGDFRTFDLGTTFDAVITLFSGIGYLAEEHDLRTGIANLARHLRPGGVLLVEGWVEPEFWIGSTVSAESGTSDGRAVARAVRTVRDGLRTELWMRYVFAAEDGLTTVDEHHVMRLSDPAEMAAAFAAAGLGSFERLPHMLHPGRSVYVGVADG